ncbi:MAG: efflux RND transporter permease subunit [Bacteroidales bacterium]|nr:efflux RND transporter permease subunit [Bacteroidales bacterium]
MLKRIIDRPISVTMVIFVAIVLGVVSTNLLPISLIPEVDVPYITVQVADAQMSARELDESVIKPLRQQLIQINGLADIRSESKDGSGMINLSFSHGADINYLFVEVNEKIDRSMSSLPDITRPKVLKTSATDIPAFYVNITLKEGSTSTFADMSRFAQDVVTKRIEQLPEVAMVDVSGFVEEEILIVPDREKLVQAGLNMERFESIVRGANVNLGSLTITDGEYRYNVKFLADVTSAEDIANVWFKSEGRLFQLKDVADVRVQEAKRIGMVRSSCTAAVSMAVIKQGQARMSDLQSGMNSLLSNFEKDYPDISFELTRDQTELLRYSINNLIKNIIMGVLLACIVIFLFMKDFRSPALVSLTMPVALVFSMAFFYVMGLSLNIISLSGLLLGVGMMTDNTIILVDNITARWQRSGNLRESVIEGTKEVTGPMLSSVLTTCAVFIPLVFTSGIAGTLFYDQAISVTVVLLTSYLVTITVIPVYYWWWYKNMPSFKPNPFLTKLTSGFDAVSWEHRTMKWFLDRPALSISVFAASFLGIILCFMYIPKEKLPQMTYSDTILDIDWNSQISLEQNAERIAEIEQIASSSSTQITSLIGVQQFVLSHSGDMGISQAQIYMSCEDMDAVEALKLRIEEYLKAEYPSAAYSFKASGNIFDMVFAGNEADLIARLRPVSASTIYLDRLNPVVGEIRKNYPSVSPVPVKTDATFVVNPELMTLYEVNYSELASALKNALNENLLFSILQGTRAVPVLTGADARSLSQILDETTIVKDGREIPVSAFMSQTYVEDLKTIVSGAEGNYYPVEMNLGKTKASAVMSDIENIINAGEDFEVSFGGAVFSNKKLVNEMIVILIVAILLLYLILASQFESLLQPLIILSEIVIDIFASLVVLWICGISINLMSMIGLIVVSGIVINDSILKIDTINRLRRDGMGIREAILEAGERRFKAIVMTSLTTILAVLPFLGRGNMGDDLQYPMSVVIIAGMTVGTIVSVFILPTLYHIIYNGRKKS